MRAVVVLHISDSPYSAVCIGYRRIAAQAAAAGHQIDILTPERFRIDRLDGRFRVLFFPFAAALWLWRRRRLYDVALFHSYSGWVFNLWRGGLPTVTAFHGLEPLEYAELDAEHRARGARLSWRYRLTHGWLMRRWLRATCRRSQLVTCLNGAERRYLLEHGWAPDDRLVLLQHGVPDMFFVDDRVYPPTATRLLVVSQWIERKGTAYLVPALSNLLRRHRELEVHCDGTRVPCDAVRGTFPEDVRARVHCRPTLTQQELSQAYRGADLFVHASMHEGFQRVAVEAMASALPIVTTAVGLVPDLLANGRDCLIVPMRDAAAIEAAVDRLIDDPALRQRLGSTARAAAERLRAPYRDQVVIDLLHAAAA